MAIHPTSVAPRLSANSHSITSVAGLGGLRRCGSVNMETTPDLRMAVAVHSRAKEALIKAFPAAAREPRRVDAGKGGHVVWWLVTEVERSCQAGLELTPARCNTKLVLGLNCRGAAERLPRWLR
jgi:hypothetical protein